MPADPPSQAQPQRVPVGLSLPRANSIGCRRRTHPSVPIPTLLTRPEQPRPAELPAGHFSQPGLAPYPVIQAGLPSHPQLPSHHARTWPAIGSLRRVTTSVAGKGARVCVAAVVAVASGLCPTSEIALTLSCRCRRGRPSRMSSKIPELGSDSHARPCLLPALIMRICYPRQQHVGFVRPLNLPPELLVRV
ncbi:hypothetical protein B0T16DRAFT_2738 [Cercophora newfieldiana]|uniref:Uncharacterized protein n=1 Tax=Cercophora newfieldiana TaxID=92897 RepID=A0AA39YLY6_9PEZI|nr:hypothetical protein B0T16DRAFT_2738 [Cercophora newfieldiana]